MAQCVVDKQARFTCFRKVKFDLSRRIEGVGCILGQAILYGRGQISLGHSGFDLALEADSENGATRADLKGLFDGARGNIEAVELVRLTIGGPEGGGVGIQIQGKPGILSDIIVCMNYVALGIQSFNFGFVGYQ